MKNWIMIVILLIIILVFIVNNFRPSKKKNYRRNKKQPGKSKNKRYYRSWLLISFILCWKVAFDVILYNINSSCKCSWTGPYPKRNNHHWLFLSLLKLKINHRILSILSWGIPLVLSLEDITEVSTELDRLSFILNSSVNITIKSSVMNVEVDWWTFLSTC